MNKQKRMIYVYAENVKFYDKLKNKSEFINKALFEAQSTEPQEIKPGGQLEAEPIKWEDDHPDPRIRETRRRVVQMDERDKQRLQENRQ